MKRPLYINDFAFRCILGNGCMANHGEVLKKLSNAERGEFTAYDVDGIMRPAATIPFDSLEPVAEKMFDNRVNRLAQNALSGGVGNSLENTIRKAVEKFGAHRVGLFIGSCDNGSEASLAALRCFKETGSFPEGYVLDYQRTDFPARFIAERYGIKGMCSVHSTACASSGSAFVAARNNLYAGNCDVAIVGGVDISSLMVIYGFASLEAMSDRPTNPFSANRSGLNLGDAAAFFVVTREPCSELSADPDGAPIKLAGCGESADADHITAPRADGEGAVQAMLASLADAQIEASQIGYVNLHGTGTRLNDSMECLAVARVFGDLEKGASVPISSTKALTGHSLGAASALETAFCCMALKSGGVLPAHLNDGVADPALPPVHLVAPGETQPGLKYCMNNSFAFGGCNVSLIFEKD